MDTGKQVNIGRAADYQKYVRPMPGLKNFSRVIDSEVCCTLCQGTKVNLYPDRLGIMWEIACRNCNGTGVMKSITRKEFEDNEREIKNSGDPSLLRTHKAYWT